MANSLTIKLLKTRSLITADAGGLEADVVPESMWQPTQIMETDFDNPIEVSSTSLSADGDSWELIFAPPSKTPDVMWYPIAMRAVLHNNIAGTFVPFFGEAAGFSINQPYGRDWAWDYVDFDPVALGFNGTGEFYYRALNPRWHAFPPIPSICESDTTAENSVGGFQLTIGTWDATAAAGTALHVDARWLGFPRPAIRSGGFYAPRMFFNPN
jgi:hypothetical protein